MIKNNILKSILLLLTLFNSFSTVSMDDPNKLGDKIKEESNVEYEDNFKDLQKNINEYYHLLYNHYYGQNKKYIVSTELSNLLNDIYKATLHDKEKYIFNLNNVLEKIIIKHRGNKDKNCLIICNNINAIVEKFNIGITKNKKTIGFEIETSYIKIFTKSENHIGFFIKNNNFPIWEIEDDTQDDYIEKENYYNLEIKTLGGLYKKDICIEMINKTTDFLSKIYLYNGNNNFNEENLLKNFFNGKEDFISFYGDTDHNFFVKNKKYNLNSYSIKPQITYKLPLKNIPDLFEHLQDLSVSQTAELLLSILKNKKELIPSPNSDLIKKHQIDILNYLLKTGSIQLIGNEKISPSVKGLCFLFIDYWLKLFVGDFEVKTDLELKSSLSVMSRISFKNMYNSLEQKEKYDFIEIFQGVIDFLPEKLNKNIVKYSAFKKIYSNVMDIKKWFDSIIYDDKEYIINKSYTDFLSPPIHLDSSYSMGKYSINDKNFALVEVRCYNPVNIDQLSNFLKLESEWFFEKMK